MQRQHIYNIPLIILMMIFICFLVHLIRVHVLSDHQNAWILFRFAFIPARYSFSDSSTQLWAFISPVSYFFLHGSYLHLFVNMLWLFAAGVPCVRRVGIFRFLLFSIFTALCAAGTHYLVYRFDSSPLIGASGVISGMMGLGSRFLFCANRNSASPTYEGAPIPLLKAFLHPGVVVFLLVWVGANFFIGSTGMPGISGAIAWESHIGGFFSGFLFFSFFDRKDKL